MLDGKIAIVTGGATGIGAAIATLFAARGADVVVTSEMTEAAMRPVVDRTGRRRKGRRQDLRCHRPRGDHPP